MSPMKDEVVSGILNCSFHSPQSLFPAHAMLLTRRLIDSRSRYLQNLYVTNLPRVLPVEYHL